MREKLKSLQDESAWLGLRQMDTKELAVWDVTYLNHVDTEACAGNNIDASGTFVSTGIQGHYTSFESVYGSTQYGKVRHLYWDGTYWVICDGTVDGRNMDQPLWRTKEQNIFGTDSRYVIWQANTLAGPRRSLQVGVKKRRLGTAWDEDAKFKEQEWALTRLSRSWVRERGRGFLSSMQEE